MITRTRCLWLCLLVLTLATAPARGQWAEQSFDLEAGWNSIYLEVDPSPHDSDSLFGGKPIEAVWLRAQDSTTAVAPEGCGPEDTSPECAPEFDTLWRVWVPEDDPHRPAMDLRTVVGNSVYLVKAAEPTNLTIVGEPCPTVQKWRTGHNLVGFHVDPADPPTIAAYLAPSPAHADTRAFEKAADGAVTEVADPATTAVASGQGYWVKSAASSDYDGPVRIDTLSLVGIDFGRKQTEYAVMLDNVTGDSRDVSLTYLPSAAVPDVEPSLPANHGEVPVIWEKLDPEAPPGELFTWVSLAEETYSRVFNPAGEAGTSNTITVGVDRSSVGAVATLTDTDDGVVSSCQGLLAVEDGQGFRRFLPRDHGSATAAVTLDRPSVGAQGGMDNRGRQDLDQPGSDRLRLRGRHLPEHG